MQVKAIISLAAFAAVAVALTDSARVYIPDGALGTCKVPVLDTDFAIALAADNWENGAFCGMNMTVSLSDGSASVNVVVKDMCTNTCSKNQIELTEAAFAVLVGPDAESGDDTVEVVYALPN
ncbi:hypothetical protein C8F01DRAFT_1338339 [Mycena amicta]|nr:hypothetical protein C8F01DRAFT_1338339 [Mycena amicta]